jgi:hypothetical protein
MGAGVDRDMAGTSPASQLTGADVDRYMAGIRAVGLSLRSGINTSIRIESRSHYRVHAPSAGDIDSDSSSSKGTR